MTKGLKYRTSLLLAAAAISLVMALAGGIVLFSGHALPAAHQAVIIAVLVLSPFPAAGAVVLVRMLGRLAKDAESYTTRDPLTGLYNQHTFWDLLQYEAERSLRQKYKFSLLLIDIDNFKVVNDKYGHEIGDRILKDFAGILRSAVRKGDIPARYAGDNFTAILPVCDEEQAYVVAKRIRDNIRNHSVALPDGTPVQETVSIGVSVFPSHARDAQDLYLLADSMLLQAKSAGKDQVAFPSEQDNVELLKNLGEKNIMILNALRGHKMKIVPYFQPIMNVKDRSITAHEVLTRIVMDEQVIPAADFIEAAESMGAIGKIDYQLMEQTFARVREQAYSGTLFLNLSPKAMIIGDFMPTVRTLFRNYGIDPGKMVFEITERDTVKNISLIEGYVRKLRSEGFRFAIDDFGSGYSSFQYLKSFPVDYLKVDGEFIRNMQGNGTVEQEIVSSIADLANRLSIRTIAEYVESEAILGQVESAGIHFAQGYFIQRPSPRLS